MADPSATPSTPDSQPVSAAAGRADLGAAAALDRILAGTAKRPRGWLVLRLLILADVLGLVLAFVAAELVFGIGTTPGVVETWTEILLFVCTLPLWIVVAKLYKLYDNDEERADHSTVDDLVGVFGLLTTGAWLFFAGASLTALADPNLPKLVTFWSLGIVLVTFARACARSIARRSDTYVQNAVVVGAGDVGQLVARKLLQHPEYRIRVLGFVDADPKEIRADVADVPVLGAPSQLPLLVSALGIERVVVAFSRGSKDETVDLIRSLRALRVQVDVVPRLYETVGPHVRLHALEGMPLMGLPTPKLFPLSRVIKRAIDIAGATAGLVLTSPLFAYIAVRIKLDSPGPVFFRQTRLGLNMREFTTLKFRTMRVDTDDAAHREYIRQTMSADAVVGANGLYKLDQDDRVTPFGRWLRRTSLDELPQLINVLRGDMSLVGPRPCIPYEVESFEPHHYERFLVPQGLTGLWQVTARARSTFGEALDLDVAYARGWSLGLDLVLLCKTPFQLLRDSSGTA